MTRLVWLFSVQSKASKFSTPLLVMFVCLFILCITVGLRLIAI
nr:MAG TPA: hypothetical protein [Bacteriophage sp.]